MALFDSGLSIYKYHFPHDPNNKVYYSRTYRPSNWQAGKEYITGDVVIPSTPNGWYYICSSGGISGGSEPVFSTVAKGKTNDNTIEWTAFVYDLLLNTGDTITSSTWVGTNGETVENETIITDGIQTSFRLVAVPINASSVTMVNSISVLRASGRIEEYDKSMIIKIKQL